MNIYLSLLLFAVMILLYWVMTELFTFFFRMTGLTAERARFQVTSLLTGTGFTTRESEIIMSSNRRRRLARITMLFGYVFNITIVSAFINVFLSVSRPYVGLHFLTYLAPLILMGLIFVLMRTRKVHAWTDNLMRRVANSIFERKEGFNAVMLVDNIGNRSIAQVSLRDIPEIYRDRTLADTRLRAETGIMVMLVERDGADPVPAHADTVFRVGDRITVFGNYKTICKTFHAREHLADD